MIDPFAFIPAAVFAAATGVQTARVRLLKAKLGAAERDVETTREFWKGVAEGLGKDLRQADAELARWKPKRADGGRFAKRREAA